MSNATFTFGRFNVPTEGGHGKLISAVQSHAEETGGTHYVFPTHSQDPKKNPLTHGEKVGFMRRMFPTANIVSNPGIRTAIDAVKHLESKGHTHVTMVVGSDRVDEFHKLLNKYRKKEFPGVKKIKVVSAGHRDPDAEGAEGVSASKLRGLIAAGKEEEFISQYSDPKLGKQIHDKAKAGMQMESINPIGIFLLGAPGSGKDYVLNNIFSRFDLTEVQADQIVNQSANELYESKTNLVINGSLDEARIAKIQDMLHEHGYTYDFVYVSVSNKVSRLRNEQRENPIAENKRIDKFLKAEKLAAFVEAHVFNNSINLNESSEMEKVFFASEIQKLLERVTALGLEMKSKPEPKSFAVIKEKYFPPVAKDKESGLPKKYVAGLSPSTAKARAAHWNKADKLSDSDPKAYEPAPGDATAKTKPSKHTLAVRKMMGEEVVVEGKADKSLAAKAEKSGISIGTLRKVYRRGVAAWNSGHRPGTTPSQWGHARVNSYINKGKTYHTADKDLREDADINELFEMQLVGTDEYRKHAIAMTPGQGEPVDAFPVKSPNKKAFAVPAKTGKSIVSQYTAEEESDCCGGSNLGAEEQTNIRTNSKNFREFRTSLKEAEEVVQLPPTADTTPTLKPKKVKSNLVPAKGLNAAVDGLPVTANFTREEKLREAVEYHLENKISFTENVFRPGSEMFFEMINEAKLLYKAGMYDPTDEWEVDMLNSEIGERAMYEGQEVILDYPFEEDVEQIDEVFNTVYPHTYHGTLRPEDPKSENGPEHMYTFRIPGKGNLRHTYSVSINRFEGKKGSLSFGYHGEQPADFVPVGEHGDRKYFESGEHEVTGEGGGKASSIISTVKSIAQTHAKKHGLKTMVFAGSSDEPSRSKLYDRIIKRMGGKKHSSEDDEFDPYREYSIPMKEDSDPTNGKGIGKPWREGGGGAVYVRDGDSIRKIRFSQSGMAKKFNDPARVRSFVARHRCLTNKDKTSASYWACRWPRFFSNSGKTWW